MHKLLLTILIQFSLISSLYALDDSKKVKSELLKAIHFSDTQEVNAITKREKQVLVADPVLQKMVDAYFEKEARILDELKTEIRAKKEADKKAKENARIAAFLAEVAKREALKENNTTLPGATPQKDLAIKTKQPIKSISRVKVTSAKSAKSSGKQVAVIPKEIKKVAHKKEVKKSPIKKYSAQTKPVTSKIVYREKTHRYLAKNKLSGEWKQQQKEKTIVFEMFADKAFILTERSEGGILSLEGHYKQEDDNLLLDITKITYNVRSRAAAVQRVYKFKTISATKLVLLDEAGRVVYTLKR